MKEKIAIKLYNPNLNQFEITKSEECIVNKLNNSQCTKVYLQHKNADKISKIKTMYVYFDIENPKNETKINKHIQNNKYNTSAYYIDGVVSTDRICEMLNIEISKPDGIFNRIFQRKNFYEPLSIEKLLKKPFEIKKLYLFDLMVNLTCSKINNSEI